ncbi:MAG: hypothetical protein ABFS03_00385 [Chloroflexota bacterium]
MDMIQERLKNPRILALVAFLVGLFIGWIVIGWGLWPLKWVDASPSYLETTWQEDYLRMAIDSYGVKDDDNKAKQRWDGLGSNAENILATIEAQPGDLDPIALQFFKDAVNVTTIEIVPDTEDELETDTELGTMSEEEAPPSSMTKIVILCAVVVILIVAVAGYLYFYRSPSSLDDHTDLSQTENLDDRIEQLADNTVQDGVPPMAQYMTTYMFGDSLFDDSFSIDSPSGKFLGECGVGIAEPSMGVGDPKKVAAFEIWLFDQRDIQTVTKVVLSDFAFSDEVLREQFETKGKLALAVPGSEIVLETATLRVVARVVDMDYGQDNELPPQSFFGRMTVELAVWQQV